MYTSGTTGKPKGVMLSHHNIVHNAWAGLQTFPVTPDDIMLSFLPLSHAFERTACYYMSMMCRRIRGLCALHHPAGGRPKDHPPDDNDCRAAHLRAHLHRHPRQAGMRPPPLRHKLFTLAVDVGWDRFEYQQGRGAWTPKLLLWPLLKRLVADKVMDRLGGRLRLSISGGAALPPEGVAHVHRARPAAGAGLRPD